jgi:hypothetical protein
MKYKKKGKDIFMNEDYWLEHVVQLIYYYWDIEIDLFHLMDVYETSHDDVDYCLHLYSTKNKIAEN